MQAPAGPGISFACPTQVLLATPVLPVWAKGGLDVGQQAPDFSVAGPDGTSLRLSAMTAANRATVVHFWATWCPPCIREMPELEVLYRKLKVQGMTLLAVNFKEAASAVRAFAEDVGASFPVVLDADGKIARQFQGVLLPATFVLDAQGVVRHKIIGATNMTALEAKITAVIRGG